MTPIHPIGGAHLCTTGLTPDQILQASRTRGATSAPGLRIDPPLPSLASMAKNATLTAAKTTVAFIRGQPTITTKEESARRESICKTSGPSGTPCPFFRVADNRCSKCGCAGGSESLIDMWSIQQKDCPLTPSKWKT